MEQGRGRGRKELPKEGDICSPEDKASLQGLGTKIEAWRGGATCLRQSTSKRESLEGQWPVMEITHQALPSGYSSNPYCPLPMTL